MEDVSVSDTTKEEDVPKKKRRVLKRVLKKDKAKEIKPKYVKRKMNTSLSSLSKSLNRSGEICIFSSLMVFNATFNNISVISWWSILLVEETE